MENILVYLTDFLGLNAYSFDLKSKKEKNNFSKFDLASIDNFIVLAQKHIYSLLNFDNYFVISILTKTDKIIFLVPNCRLENYIERDFNFFQFLQE